uniref:TerB family tellurite resistance protein n=1 Tax=Flavobacterium sp. TaxID=239 RepID=UPI00404A1CC9
MSIKELYDSGFKGRNKGHFAAIVRVALSDGKIGKEEQNFLDRLARNLEISQPEYEEILENPTKFPINPPYLYLHRLERLYDLARMVYVDDNLGENQRSIVLKFAIGLGFTPGNVNYIVDKALSLLSLKVDLDTFIFEMQNMNK